MKKALVVGIDDYPQGSLQGCCNDAKEVSKLLLRNEDGSPNFEVKLKMNVKSKGELLRLIDNCFSGDTDCALFYYSGHGYIDSIGGYLVTPDFSYDDFGVSLYEVLNIVNNSKCKNKIIILDSCYSGFIGSINTNLQSTSFINEGVTILTASRASEASVEKDGHGLFTSLLIEALSGSSADIAGNITPGGIYAYIDKALGSWGQRPVFKTNITSFVSLRKTIPQVDLSIIRKMCDYFESENTHFKLDPSFEPTNSPNLNHVIVKPYSNATNSAVFSDLQKMESVGLVIPIGEEHMYYAAMNSKSCALTSLGKQYWRLVSKGYI